MHAQPFPSLLRGGAPGASGRLQQRRSIAAGHIAGAGRRSPHAPRVRIIRWCHRRSPCLVGAALLIIMPAVIPEGPRILQKPKCEGAQYNARNQKDCSAHHSTHGLSGTEHGRNARHEKKLSRDGKKLNGMVRMDWNKSRSGLLHRMFLWREHPTRAAPFLGRGFFSVCAFQRLGAASPFAARRAKRTASNLRRWVLRNAFRSCQLDKSAALQLLESFSHQLAKLLGVRDISLHPVLSELRLKR